MTIFWLIFAFVKEAGQSLGSTKEKKLVCEPDPQNITLIFRPMMKFIEEIEQALGCKPGYDIKYQVDLNQRITFNFSLIRFRNSCTLNTFIADYVKEVYLGRHHVIVATAIDTATKSQEAWRATTSPELMKELGLARPLLQVILISRFNTNAPITVIPFSLSEHSQSRAMRKRAEIVDDRSSSSRWTLLHPCIEHTSQLSGDLSSRLSRYSSTGERGQENMFCGVAEGRRYK